MKRKERKPRKQNADRLKRRRRPKKVSEPSAIRALDLFCGAGGSSCGARLAGAEVVAGIDMSELAVATFKENFPLAQTYSERLESLDPKKIAKDIGPIDLLIASPECTHHSIARGKRRRREESRATAFQVTRFAEIFKPRWIVIENVVKMRQWPAYKKWLRALAKDYNVLEMVLNANKYGVPQHRRRLFIVCDRHVEPTKPEPKYDPKATVSSFLGSGQNGQVWRFSALKKKGRAKATLSRARRAIKALGERRRFLLVYYGSDWAGGYQEITRPLRTITTLDRFALVKPNGDGHEMRMLQPPELAVAMGFPENYKWPAMPRRSRIRLLGNAVCPPVMQAIVEGLIATRNAPAKDPKSDPVRSVVSALRRGRLRKGRRKKKPAR